MNSELRSDATDLLNNDGLHRSVSVPEMNRICRVAESVLRLTDPTPFDEQWLREVGFADRADDPYSLGWLCRGDIQCRRSYADNDVWVFWVSEQRTGIKAWANPSPQTRGDVFQLIERVERGAANG